MAETQDNLLRSVDKSYDSPMTQNELNSIAEKNTKQWVSEKVYKEAEAQIQLWYKSYSQSIRHVARAFPSEHVQKFKKRFPEYNLTNIFGLNAKSGLSNFLSFYPNDPMYLRPLEYDAEGLPVRSKDGRMTPALRLLLHSNHPIPLV